MSDQQTPPTEEPITAADTPQGGTGEPEVNWQEKYKNLEADHTRAAQEAAELRRKQDDIDYFRELAARHGYQLNEEEDPEVGEYDDPTDRLDQRLTQIEQTWAQMAEQAQQQQIEQRDVEYIGGALQEFQEKAGRELTQEEIGLLGDAAWANRDENGVPRVADVLASYEASLNAQQQRWRGTKRAPHISPNGQAATQQKNVVDMTRQERQDWMAEQLQANEQ